MIPPELIARVDETLKLFERHKPKTSKYGNVYLLSGIMKDDVGNPFFGSSGKGGQNLYYYNSTKNGGERKSLQKEKIEAIVIDRLQQYMAQSKTLEKLIEATLKNRLVGLPLIEEEIPRTQREVDQLMLVVDRFSATMRDAALSSHEDLIKVTSILTAEKEKAERDLTAKQQQLKVLMEKKGASSGSIQK